MPWVPFTVHVRVTPARGKRFVMVRDLQKIATLVYDGLDDVTTLNLARPGGGQQQSYHQYSGLTHGMAAKPRIGLTPAQLQVTGFFDVTRDNIQVHPNKDVLHTGTHETGPTSHSYDANPVATINSEVASLKSVLESNITAALPSGVTFSIFRLDYAGVVYGDRGYHFPSS